MKPEMPFLDVVHSNSVEAKPHTLAKALKKALKASKMTTQQNGAVAERMSAEEDNNEVAAQGTLHC